MSLFSKKTQPAIDPVQKELIENAQARVRQKKGLYRHLILFIAGAILLIIMNLVLGIGKETTFFNIDWFVWAILVWTFIFLVHVLNVFILHKFMGKAWEDEQIDRLVKKQQERIDKLEDKVIADHAAIEKKSNNPNPLPNSKDQNIPL